MIFVNVGIVNLRELGFNYLEIALLINVSQILGLFSMRYWGRTVDRIGPFSIIRTCSLCVSIYPIFWIVIFFLPLQLKLATSIILASLHLSFLVEGHWLWIIECMNI